MIIKIKKDMILWYEFVFLFIVFWENCFMYMEVKVILFILGFVGLGGLGDFWVFYGLKYVISLVGFVVYV